MKNIEIRPFKAEDGLGFDLAENDKGLRSLPGYEGNLRACEGEGLSYTLLHKGKIAGCGGVKIYWPGVGEAWVLLDKSVNIPGQVFAYHCADRLDMIINHNKLWRVQAVARIDFLQASRFLEFLTFKRETILEKFGTDGMDCILYKRITEKWTPQQ